MIKPRHDYEVTETSVGPGLDHQSAIVLIDTAGPIDLGLRANRRTLELLRLQLDTFLKGPIQPTDQ